MNRFDTAWLLHSTLRAGENNGASLRDVIAFGDYTNHAIMTYAEFSLALAWLVALELVHEADGKLFTSSHLRANLPPLFSRKIPDYVKELEWLAGYLTALPAAAALPDIHTTETEFNAAVAAYLGSKKN